MIVTVAAVLVSLLLKMHFQPELIPLYSFVFSLNPVGWTLKYSLLPKWKCSAWVCLLTHLCCHVHAYVPAVSGLWEKNASFETEYSAERKPCGYMTKTVHGAKWNSNLVPKPQVTKHLWINYHNRSFVSARLLTAYLKWAFVLTLVPFSVPGDLISTLVVAIRRLHSVSGKV